jgi:hypothetical protein
MRVTREEAEAEVETDTERTEREAHQDQAEADPIMMHLLRILFSQFVEISIFYHSSIALI